MPGSPRHGALAGRGTAGVGRLRRPRSARSPARSTWRPTARPCAWTWRARSSRTAMRRRAGDAGAGAGSAERSILMGAAHAVAERWAEAARALPGRAGGRRAHAGGAQRPGLGAAQAGPQPRGRRRAAALAGAAGGPAADPEAAGDVRVVSRRRKRADGARAPPGRGRAAPRSGPAPRAVLLGAAALAAGRPGRVRACAVSRGFHVTREARTSCWSPSTRCAPTAWALRLRGRAPRRRSTRWPRRGRALRARPPRSRR